MQESRVQPQFFSRCLMWSGGVVLVSLLCCQPALAVGLAEGSTDLARMLLSLQETLPILFRAATAVVYVLGFVVVLKAMYDLKAYGELRTMMMGNTDLRGPVVKLLMGACLVYLPTALDISLGTVFSIDRANILAYNPPEDTQATQAMFVVINIVRFIGLISFVRGLLIMSKIDKQSGASFGKGVTHILGGVMAVNIVGTMNILANTFGISLPCI